MDYPTLFASVQSRPGMYLPGQTHPEAAAFVLGVDAGNAWGLLHGFREWLLVRLDGQSNLTWAALILRQALPGRAELWLLNDASKLDATQHAAARDLLFSLLLEFLADRDRPNRLADIYGRYAAWQASRDAEAT